MFTIIVLDPRVDDFVTTLKDLARIGPVNNLVKILQDVLAVFLAEYSSFNLHVISEVGGDGFKSIFKVVDVC